MRDSVCYVRVGYVRECSGAVVIRVTPIDAEQLNKLCCSYVGPTFN